MRYAGSRRSCDRMAELMKLLVVGHTYITAFSQSKYAAMKRMRDNLQLRLVVPREVNHVFMTYRPGFHPGLEPHDLVTLPAIFSRSHMTCVLHPGRLAALLETSSQTTFTSKRTRTRLDSTMREGILRGDER